MDMSKYFFFLKMKIVFGLLKQDIIQQKMQVFSHVFLKPFINGKAT